MRKLNLLYLIDGGPGWGGTEANLLSVAKHIDRKRYNVEIGCLVEGQVADTFRNSGLPVTIIGMKNKWDMVAVIRLVQLLRKKKIDIFHTCLYTSNTFGRIAAILARTPVTLSWEHGIAPFLKLPRHIWVDWVLNKFTDAIVAVSHAVKRSITEVEKISEAKIHVVYNGVEPPQLNPSFNAKTKKIELGLGPEDRVLPYIASLGPPKGHKYFLPAIKKLIKDFPDVKFLFVGEGSLRGEIEREIERLGLKENVLLCGFRKDIPEILSTAEFYIHPSTREALSIAILEAMVMGKAVVANKVGGIPEAVVEGETGLLVPPKDTEAMARAIIELLQSPPRAREMGEKGRQRVLDYFSAERSARGLEKIYEQFIVAKILPREGSLDEEARRLITCWVKEIYARNAQQREKTLASTPFWAHESEAEQRALLELLRPAGGEKILEVGCGSGRDAILFTSKGARYVGLDYDYRTVNVARTRLVKENIRGIFLVADATRLPFKDCSFDTVSCSEVIEHIPGYEKALKEMGRVLKPGGKAGLTTPNRHGVNGMVEGLKTLMHRTINRVATLDSFDPYDKWKTRGELKLALREGGLEVKEEMGINFIPDFLKSSSLWEIMVKIVEPVEDKIKRKLPGLGNTIAVLAEKGPIENADKAPTVNILPKENLTFLLFRKLKEALSGKGIGKIPGVLPLYWFIYTKLKPDGVILMEVQGSKMYVDYRDEGLAPYLFSTGVYGRQDTELFKEQIRPGMVVVDVGANIGYYALIAAKLVGNEGKVYAFEPVSNNYDLLVANIKVNGYTNIIPIPKAVSNKCGKALLFINKVNLTTPSLSQDNVTGHISTDIMSAGLSTPSLSRDEVETITLDKFFEGAVGVEKVDFLKMDVEGYEGLVIEGAEKVLKGNNLKIFMEFWPYGLKNAGTDSLKLLHRLQDYGFKMKLMGNSSTGYVEIRKIIEICGSKPDGHVNLFLEK